MSDDKTSSRSVTTGILVELENDGAEEEYEIVEVPEKIKDTVLGGAAKDIQLCGYLAKVNHGGLLKGSKRRWFVFEQDTCTLKWYRSPKDVHESPIGTISVSNCVFTCTAEGLLENSFQITQGSRTHILLAQDQRTMLWWIQELQSERRTFNAKRKHAIARSPLSKHPATPLLLDLDNEAISTGLLGCFNTQECAFDDDDDESYGDSLSLIPVLPRVENPPETVGIESAKLSVMKPAQHTGLSDIGNKVANIGGGITKLRPKPQRPPPPSPSSIFYAKRDGEPLGDTLTLGPSLDAKRAEHKHKSPLEWTSSGFSHLLDKLQNVLKTSGKPLHESKQVDEIKETLVLLKEEMDLMKTSLNSKDETIELLKRELNKYSAFDTAVSTKNQTNESCVSSSHQVRSEITTHKLTIEHLRQELDESNLRLNQEQEKNELLQEMIKVKDGMVVKLTNELHEFGVKSRSNAEIKKDEDTVMPTKMEHNMAEILPSARNMQDEVEAYRLQNKFLNNEILELTRLRKVDHEKIDLLYEKVMS